MSWWASITHAVTQTATRLAAAAKGLARAASLDRWAHTAATLAANTSFHVLEEGLALKQAIPTFTHNPKARQVINGMAYLVVHDILPLLTLNYINQRVQRVAREGYDEHEASFVYSALISALTISNYLVTAYSWRRGSQTYVRVVILDSFAPDAFNPSTDKTALPSCIKPDCNSQYKMQWELGILLANEALIGAIRFSQLPYIGEPLALVLGVINNGRYIVRLATPVRCQHVWMKFEFVLALGLTYEKMLRLMNDAALASLGSLPFLYQMALSHMLLTLHAGVVAHMQIPFVKPSQATLPFDLFNTHEELWRFNFDVILLGLLKKVPACFKSTSIQSSFTPLPFIARWAKRLLNSELEQKDKLLHQSQVVQAMKNWVVPSMFHNVDAFIRDRIISFYWEEIRRGAITLFDTTEAYGKTRAASALAWSPKTAAVVLDLKFGIPKQLTKLVLMLSQQRDFWTLTRVIKEWFLRHHLNPHAILISEPASLVPLSGDKPLLAAPSTIGVPPVLSSDQLILGLEFNLSLDAPLVAPVSEAPPDIALSSVLRGIARPADAAINPHALFATRGKEASTHDPEHVTVILNNYFER